MTKMNTIGIQHPDETVTRKVKVQRYGTKRELDPERPASGISVVVHGETSYQTLEDARALVNAGSHFYLKDITGLFIEQPDEVEVPEKP